MKKYTLNEGLYAFATPGGAFHAVANSEDEPSRRLLQGLLRCDTTPRLNAEQVREWSGVADQDQALQLLHHVQNLAWVHGLEQSERCPNQPLEDILPDLLSGMAPDGKALLADHQGFYLAAIGFPHEVAEELSALSAELANLNERRSSLLVNNLGYRNNAWALIDAAGCSKVGFWPLYVGRQRFVLVISGLPRLNSQAFVQLVWTLSMRYAVSSTLN